MTGIVHRRDSFMGSLRWRRPAILTRPPAAASGIFGSRRKRMWPPIVAAPQGASENSSWRKPWVGRCPTELFLVSVGAPDGAIETSLAPLPGLKKTRKNKTPGRSFTHSLRCGLLSGVPSALNPRRRTNPRRPPFSGVRSEPGANSPSHPCRTCPAPPPIWRRGST